MRHPLIALFLALPVLLSAQVSIGGTPSEWLIPTLDRSDIPVIEMGPLEDPPQPTEGDFRYGVQRFHSADVLMQGRWDVLPEGMLLCRLAIHSDEAVMLSVQFDQWELNEGDVVYLYNADRTHFIGGFDAANRGEDGTMATAVVPGDEVVIEYRTTGIHRRPARLHLASITHGYVDIFRFNADGNGSRDYWPGFESAICQVNISCPQAAAWQTEKRSVAMFLRPDGDGCTGNLVNNTQTPGRPYFHIAQHCYAPTTSQWVFYFNYEAAQCTGTHAQMSEGPTNQTLTGATLRANYYYSDAGLVELSSSPPTNYNVYYAGWDRSGAVPQTTSLIEHPMYDVKKFAFNADPSTTYTFPNGIACWEGTWEIGLLQATASGAPAFDQNHRMVGHMYDGAQNCTNLTSLPSQMVKFSGQWNGPTAAERLRDWLDPSNTVMTLDGYDPNASPTVSLRVRTFLEGPYNTGTTQMNSTLSAGGLIPMTEPYTTAGYTHVGGGGETTNSTVLNVTGANAVVDWVVVELRNKNNSSQVLATRSALLQADGDVVAANDGTSALTFGASGDQYFIAVRHRNHLGIMSAGSITLGSAAITVDLSNGTVPLSGGSSATKVIGARNVMFAGDVDRNSILRYTGQANDRDPILARVGGSIPTATVNGYFPEDVNLDGVVRYIGASNDRDPILVNVGGTIPTATRTAQLP
ncbi:MAG: hypothetical protein IPI81_05420 [Flavobacteriales bacterium]|nr:hypothetical protein [Flavobacteriales bacterium]